MQPAMKPQEVTEALQLSKLKDKIWYVVPSCATTGEGLFEGLVSTGPIERAMAVCSHWTRAGCQTTSRRPRNDSPDKRRQSLRYESCIIQRASYMYNSFPLGYPGSCLFHALGLSSFGLSASEKHMKS